MEKVIDFSNNEVTHVKNGKLEYLTFKALEKYKDKVLAVVTLRHGGVSESVNSSLNFRMAGSDKKENVLENLNIICDELGINPNEVYKARQDHTDNILYITEENKQDYSFEKVNDERIDGYITGSGITTLVITADCNAIIIYDTKNNKVANVHSGWKGTTKKIYLRAIEKMQELFHTKTEDLIVCVSPSVLKCCFSSEDENFKKIFTDIWPYENEYITQNIENPKRFHIDIPYVITKDLTSIGVKEENIHFAGICTCCNNEHFYSYRSKTQKGEQDYGCMATIVKVL
ncbi:MAG: peptidoglycan editing factor PgeF [Clostridia bacterium]|nr:peptidoglycan editing factor PgeF [Clostridia bacterium]